MRHEVAGGIIVNIEKDKSFITGKIELDETIKLSFDNLDADQYTSGKFQFRKRAYSLLSLKNVSELEWQDSIIYFQNKEINAYAGGISRVFSPLKPGVKSYVINFISEVLGKEIDVSRFLIGIHQIQICCDYHNPGHPSPEGFHRDGYDYIFIVNYGSGNIEGGTSFIKNADQKITLRRQLKDGEYIFFNDREYEHYASPIISIFDNPGFRNVFVLTFREMQ